MADFTAIIGAAYDMTAHRTSADLARIDVAYTD